MALILMNYDIYTLKQYKFLHISHFSIYLFFSLSYHIELIFSSSLTLAGRGIKIDTEHIKIQLKSCQLGTTT